MSEIQAPVSFGELLDKIAILQIKSERMTDQAKLANVRNELSALERTWLSHPAAGGDIARLRADLKAVNAGDSGLGTKRGGFAGFVYRDRRKPVIVAVDGLATAGGCEIVLAADLVVATTRSSFGLAEVKRNLIAGAGGLFRLPRAIGQAAAMEAILTGEPFTAQRAYDLGLVRPR